MKEIQIIGGGLAGLSLGIGLRLRDIPVILHERGTYPQHKVCGEFICGVEDAVLKTLGIEHTLHDAKIHCRIKWWMNGDLAIEKSLPLPARGISRYILDQRLANYFEELGGKLKLKSRVLANVEEGVIRASGKRKSGSKEWIGLKLHFNKNNVNGLEMHCGHSGYIGLCAVSSDKMNACGLFKVNSKIRGRRKQLFFNYLRFSGLKDLANQLEEFECDEESFSAIAGFSLGKQQGPSGFSIGDAHHLIPPFSGNGMSMAIESSAFAIQPVVDYALGEISWQNAQLRYHQSIYDAFKKRTSFASNLHPLLFHQFGRFALKKMANYRVLPVSYLFNQLRTP